jgi:ribonuclease I
MRRWLLALAILVGLSSSARAQVTDHYTLLMVWMPGLCKLEPDRAECKDLTLRRYDGLNLAFLALQSVRSSNAPNTFCYTMLGDQELDRSRQWCDMYRPRILDTLAVQLKIVMPVMQSCQDRALWSRYASCTMYSADDYYSRGIKLARSVSGTQFNSKIAAAVGQTAKQSDLVAAVAADFGDEKTNAVDFICRKIEGKFHLLQVRIALTPRAVTRGLAPELLWKPTNPLRRSCPENILVDAPPVPIAGTGAGTSAPAKPAPPPGEPPVPESSPVAPVETEPLNPQGPVVR